MFLKFDGPQISRLYFRALKFQAYTSRTSNFRVLFFCQTKITLGGQCLGGQWTRWFNTDHPLSPTGELRKGDLETLDRAQLESRRVCDYPIGFKIAIDDGNNGQGLDVNQFDDEIHLTYDGPTMGVRCYNGEQSAKLTGSQNCHIL